MLLEFKKYAIQIEIEKKKLVSKKIVLKNKSYAIQIKTDLYFELFSKLLVIS
jgi:hypothetical protein